MNILVRGYLPWRWIPNWPKNIRHFFRTLKYAYQRVTKGYCDTDVWSLCDFYAELISTTLNELADVAHGWPGEYTGLASFEDWQEELRKIAECFKNAEEQDDVDEYFKAYIESKEARGIDNISNRVEDTPEEKELLEKSLNQMKLEADLREKNKNEGLELLSKWWFHIWD